MGGTEEAIETTTMRRVGWRILPFLMLCYFIAFVDRVNSGFAALQMNEAVGISPAAFGLAGTLFYAAYVLFEVPSNLAMVKVGARFWIARIMISWGLVSGASAWVVGPNSFCVSRFLLGAAEAGFFPGVILYLTTWFPAAYRGRVVAVFMVAIPISSFAGSPISAHLLQTDGLLGLGGWQWLFIIEAVPAVLLGILALVVLPDRPATVNWLTPAERAWLITRLANESTATQRAAHPALWRVLIDPYVLTCAIVYAGASGASQCLSLWLPQIIRALGFSESEVGWINMIPFGLASVAMLWWGRRSDRLGERLWHTALPLALLAGSLVATLATGAVVPTVVLLVLAVVGTYAFKGPFWALATQWLSAGAAAAGIAQINAIGNLGGLVGNGLLGLIKEETGSYPLGLLPLALLCGAGFVGLLVLGRRAPVVPAGSTPAAFH